MADNKLILLQTAVIAASVKETLEIHPLINYGTEDNPLWRATTVSRYINYKAIHNAIKGIPENGKVKKRCMLKPGGMQLVVLLNQVGVCHLLANKKMHTIIYKPLHDVFGITIDYEKC